MGSNNYETGRLNLPFVGHCTFAKQPICLDWDAIDADVAVLGIPYDMGTQYRSGARFGPRAIREASTLFSFGHGGAYDHEDDTVYLPTNEVQIVDIGDADIIHTDTIKSHENTEFAVRKILKSGALPLCLGGDHAVHIPCIRAFDNQQPVHIIHIDAHLDFEGRVSLEPEPQELKTFPGKFKDLQGQPRRLQRPPKSNYKNLESPDGDPREVPGRPQEAK